MQYLRADAMTQRSDEITMENPNIRRLFSPKQNNFWLCGQAFASFQRGLFMSEEMFDTIILYTLKVYQKMFVYIILLLPNLIIINIINILYTENCTQQEQDPQNFMACPRYIKKGCHSDLLYLVLGQ